MRQVTVAYVYGASDRSADDSRDEIIAGLGRAGIEADFRPIAWAQGLATNARPSDLDWIVRRRFQAPSAPRTAEPTPKPLTKREVAEIAAVVDQAATKPPPPAREAALLQIPRPLLRFAYQRTMPGTFPILVDVLSYLRRPDQIIGYVSAQLDLIRRESGERPVVAVGLSLGGIMLVDTLAQRVDENPPAVDLVVTVGSQAPVLLAADALGTIRRDDKPPLRPFVPWLNVWNPHDYLSFPAGPLFGDFVRPRWRLRDVQGKAGSSFPHVHGDYWSDETTFAAIGAMVERVLAERAAPSGGDSGSAGRPKSPG